MSVDASLALSQRSLGGARLVLSRFRSLLFFHGPGVYFGDDSVALARRQRVRRAGVALDLCAGSGIQAMIAARRGARTYAVEIDRFAASVARVNVAMNGLDEVVDVVHAPLEEFASASRGPYDSITMNPPLLPVPPEVDFPPFGNGGADGLEITRRALDLYLPQLRRGGSFDLIGSALGTGARPSFVAELSPLLASHGARGRMELLGRSRLEADDPFHEALLRTLSCTRAAFARHARRLGASDIFIFFLRITKSVERRTPARPLLIVDRSAGRCAAQWLG